MKTILVLLVLLYIDDPKLTSLFIPVAPYFSVAYYDSYQECTQSIPTIRKVVAEMPPPGVSTQYIICAEVSKEEQEDILVTAVKLLTLGQTERGPDINSK